MSQQLAVCLIAVAANLVGLVIIYAVMSQALARLAWRGRGAFGVVLLTVVAQLFWIAPALMVVVPRDSEGASSYALWFGNWIVTGFALVLFSWRAKRIPRSLEDSARMDGLGAFGIWRQVVFPFVRRELGLIALFTVMATLLPFWAFITEPNIASSIVIYQRVLSSQGRLALMAGVSLAGVLPLVAIFLLARKTG